MIIVEFDYVLTGFLPAGSVYFWHTGVEVSSSNSGFTYSSCGSVSVCLMYFDAPLLDTYTLGFFDFLERNACIVCNIRSYSQ